MCETGMDQQVAQIHDGQIIIIIIIEFLTSQILLGIIHLSWDVVINRIRLGDLICSLKSVLLIIIIIIIIIF